MRRRGGFLRRLWRRFRRWKRFVRGFDGAGPAATTTSGPPIFYAAAEIDDGAFRLELAAGELEGLLMRMIRARLRQLEIAMIEVAVNADGAEDGCAIRRWNDER